MGRKPKLTNDKEDEKYQRDATSDLLEATKDLESLQSSPPKILQGRARYMYQQITPELVNSSWVKNLDLQIVVSLCMSYQMLYDGYDDINENGQVCMTDNGMIKKNPSVDVVNNAIKNIKTLSSELGLTPASRATLFNVEDEDEGMSIDDMQKEFGS